MINKKLESLEIVERSITYTRTERKNDSFLDLYEKMKAVNFEPHHRTPSEKTMIEIESGSIIKTVDKRLKSTNRKAKEKDDIERQKSNNKKDDLIMERTTCIEDKEKGNSAIEIIQEKNDIERQKTIIRRGTVKEMIERMERQNNSTLKIANKETSSIQTIQKKDDMIDIEREKGKIMKEIEEERQKDSLIDLVDKEWRHNSLRENDRLKKEIDKRLKSIERSMTETQDNSLAKLTKKIEILNSPLGKSDIKRDIVVLDIIESSDNEKTDRHTRNTIFHKCKKYGHTKKQCGRHNKIVKQISKLDFEKRYNK